MVITLWAMVWSDRSFWWQHRTYKDWGEAWYHIRVMSKNEASSSEGSEADVVVAAVLGKWAWMILDMSLCRLGEARGRVMPDVSLPVILAVVSHYTQLHVHWYHHMKPYYTFVFILYLVLSASSHFSLLLDWCNKSINRLLFILDCRLQVQERIAHGNKNE